MPRLNTAPVALTDADEPLYVVRFIGATTRPYTRAEAEQALATGRALGADPRDLDLVAAAHADGEVCPPHAECPADECEAHAQAEAALDGDADRWADR